MATIIRNSGGGGKIAYQLAINTPTGVAAVTVTRTVSGLGESELLGVVTADDPIYKDDVLVTSGTADNGYDDLTGITYEVTGNAIVTVTAGDPTEYDLSKSKPTSVDTLSMTRTASPLGGFIGQLSASDSIYYGDIIVTSGTAVDGYSNPTGLTYTVSGNTIVTVTAGLLNVSFANATWSQVKEIADGIRDGTYTVQTASSGYKYISFESYVWTVGDTKTLTIDVTDYAVRIVDFQHWTNANNVGTAYAAYGNTDAVNMEMVEVYACVAHGTSSNWTGIWSASSVYTYLTGTFFNLLPTDFSDNLLNVTVRSSQGRTSPTSIVTTNGKCNLASMEEVGVGSYEYSSSYSTYEDGYELNYYSVNNSDSERIKYYDSSAAPWWTRTPSSLATSIYANMRAWSRIKSTGAGAYINVNTYETGVSPIFSY
ncbi:MAG: DUF6273 domain-containing protein [Bacillota bacterium]